MNTPMILGRQTFDGLGRQRSVEAAGYTTHFEYTKGQLPPTANRLADGTRVAFTYEAQLNNRLLSVEPAAEPAQQIRYHPLGMPASAKGALGTEAFTFSAAGQPSHDIWTIDGTQHDTQWHYSLNGLLQGFDDPQKGRHRRSFDARGRVTQTHAGKLTTRYEYDALSRPIAVVVDDPHNRRTLTTALTYDSLGRESTRTFTCTEIDKTAKAVTRTFVQTLGYSAFDQIASRRWEGGERPGTETFEYDARNRLVSYVADKTCAPEDPFGNRILRQTFTFNALDGHEKVVTVYADRSTDEALFTYAVNNPVQLVKVTHTHPSWPRVVTLTYDACGRVIGDSLGRRMRWNAQDRLTEVRHNDQRCQYRYTAHGWLADRILDGAVSRSFFSGEDLTHEVTGNDSVQFHSGEQGLFAISKVAAGIRQTTLLGCDAQGSVRLEADDQVRTRRYTSHGSEAEHSSTDFGYAGQRREPLTGWQILGDYRPYDPVLMCFLSPDSLSPFGAGGLNPYAYCAGDPVNRVDPDGHSWVNYGLAGLGLTIGVLTAIASFGAATAVAASIATAGWAALTPSAAMIIIAGMLDLVSLGTGVAALAVEFKGGDRNVVSILGWVSLGTGIAAGILSGQSTTVARLAGRKPRPPSPVLRRSAHADILFEESFKNHDVVFHETLWGSNSLKGFETHGTSEGFLLNAKGVYEPAANVAKQEIAPRLGGYAKHSPLVLLACEGGSSGAAQQVANVLRRPVIGYDKSIYLGDPSRTARMIHYQAPWGLNTSLPVQRVPFPKRWRTNGKAGAREKFELATWRYYYPQ